MTDAERPGWKHRRPGGAPGVRALLLGLALPLGAAAQEASGPGAEGTDVPANLEELTLEELLDVPIAVAAGAGGARSARETPGIVTVLTRDEILRTGARDLIDVLRLVPGLQFGQDVQGVVGLGVRGLWGHEGKVLLLLDGQELNEPLFATTQFGNRIQPSQIDRVEVIRGPGSVLYGGFAELAVVNVITRSAAQLQGLSASASYGQMARAPGRTQGALSYGQTFGDLQVVAHASAGLGRRSDRDVTGLDGVTTQLQDPLQQLQLNVGAGWKGVQARVLLESYRVGSTLPFGETAVPPVQTDFTTLLADLSYAWDLGAAGVLKPRLTVRRMQPWASADEDAAYDKSAERLTAGLTYTNSFGPALRTLAGVEAYRETARDMLGTFRTTGGPTLTLGNVALFAEAAAGPSWLQVTAGARYEKHSLYPQVLVPRLVATSLLGRFHAKLLLSRAFRAPAIENLDRTPGILPEKTGVLELEAGYRLTEDMQLTANVFDIRVDDPIVFFIPPETGSGIYGNFGRTGSRGVELEYRVHGAWGDATLSGAYYRAHRNRVDLYRVSGTEEVLVGLSPLTLSANVSLRLSPKLSVNPSLVYLGGGSQQQGTSATGAPLHQPYPAALLANLFVRYQDALVRGLDVSLGVHDALNTARPFYQPYNSNYPALPGPSREVLLRLDYHLPL